MRRSASRSRCAQARVVLDTIAQHPGPADPAADRHPGPAAAPPRRAARHQPRDGAPRREHRPGAPPRPPRDRPGVRPGAVRRLHHLGADRRRLLRAAGGRDPRDAHPGDGARHQAARGHARRRCRSRTRCSRRACRTTWRWAACARCGRATCRPRCAMRWPTRRPRTGARRTAPNAADAGSPPPSCSACWTPPEAPRSAMTPLRRHQLARLSRRRLGRRPGPALGCAGARLPDALGDASLPLVVTRQPADARRRSIDRAGLAGAGALGTAPPGAAGAAQPRAVLRRVPAPCRGAGLLPPSARPRCASCCDGLDAAVRQRASSAATAGRRSAVSITCGRAPTSTCGSRSRSGAGGCRGARAAVLRRGTAAGSTASSCSATARRSRGANGSQWRAGRARAVMVKRLTAWPCSAMPRGAERAELAELAA